MVIRMIKVAVVTDSNSGISQKEAAELGIFVLPMPFTIDDETYYEDINLSIPEFYEKLKNDANIFTSQPSPEEVMKLWDSILNEYDEIVHIPMSSGLSGSCQSAMMLANDYDGKVQVVNNQRISVTQKRSVLDAKELTKYNKTAIEIKDILENDKFNSTIYIMLDTLYYLKKGGRITPAAAALGTLLKLKPVLTIQGDKLDAFAKARTTAQGKTIMTTAVKNDISNRLGGVTKEDSIWMYVAHTENEEAAKNLKAELQNIFPAYTIEIAPLSLSVACHIGPGSLAIACCQKMDYEKQ